MKIQIHIFRNVMTIQRQSKSRSNPKFNNKKQLNKRRLDLLFEIHLRSFMTSDEKTIVKTNQNLKNARTDNVGKGHGKIK